jgi:hypothetical protein
MNSSLTLPARVVVDPVDAVPQAVSARRKLWPVVFLCAASAFSGLAFALHFDVQAAVFQKLAMMGQLDTITDHDLAEKITQARHLAIVGGVAKGIFLMPLVVLLVAALLKFVSWLIGRKVKFGQLFSVVAVAMIPIAVANLAFGICALFQYSIPVEKAQTLLPSNLAAWIHVHSPKLMHLLSGVDFFNLWTVALLGLGYSQASGMKKGRALAFALILYLCFVGVFLVGLPALSAGGPPHGGHHR